MGELESVRRRGVLGDGSCRYEGAICSERGAFFLLWGSINLVNISCPTSMHCSCLLPPLWLEGGALLPCMEIYVHLPNCTTKLAVDPAVFFPPFFPVHCTLTPSDVGGRAGRRKAGVWGWSQSTEDRAFALHAAADLRLIQRPIGFPEPARSNF